MAKHAADNGGFFGLFKKKKESYYDFTDTSKTKKHDEYESGGLDGLRKDYTSTIEEPVIEEPNIEDNGENVAKDLTPDPDNIIKINNTVKDNAYDIESTQEVESVSQVPLNEEEFNNSYNTYVKGGDYDYHDYDYEDEDAGTVKKIIIAVVIFVLIAGLATYFIFFRKPKVQEEPVEEETVQEEKMISTLGGAKVLGKLTIDDLKIEQYILDSTSETALENGVGKIDNGAKLNTNGNFCIAGHNKEEVFKDLSNLVEGNEITITDRDLKEYTYVVKEFREVAPDNLECLLQDSTKEKLTLITCKDGATERILVIAERK